MLYSFFLSCLFYSFSFFSSHLIFFPSPQTFKKEFFPPGDFFPHIIFGLATLFCCFGIHTYYHSFFHRYFYFFSCCIFIISLILIFFPESVLEWAVPRRQPGERPFRSRAPLTRSSTSRRSLSHSRRPTRSGLNQCMRSLRKRPSASSRRRSRDSGTSDMFVQLFERVIDPFLVCSPCPTVARRLIICYDIPSAMCFDSFMCVANALVFLTTSSASSFHRHSIIRISSTPIVPFGHISPLPFRYPAIYLPPLYFFISPSFY